MRSVFALLVISVAACSSAPPVESQGRSGGTGQAAAGPAATGLGTKAAPIVNGTSETGWPSVGALVYEYPGYGYQGQFCTGTLIAARWVLTAAHCLSASQDGFTITAGMTYFYVGSNALPSGNGWPAAGTLYPADAFYVHPDYDPNAQVNDVALVRLTQNVAGVTPTAINASYLASSYTGSAVTYVGFGATDGINQTGSGIKRKGSMNITYIGDTTYESEYAGQGICFGDSGGPGLLQLGGTWKVIGVNSAVAGCAPGDTSCDPCQIGAIVTRVDPYVPWINGYTGAPLPSCKTQADLCLCAAACQADGSCNSAACQTMSCKDVYNCLGACAQADSACASGCYAQGTAIAKSQYNDLTGCFQTQCGSVPDAQFQTCATTKCASELDTCLPTATGAKTCSQVYDCLGGCNGDSACSTACYESGTATAQSQLNTMLGCFDQNCGTVADADFSSCAQTNCANEIEECIPTTYGNNDCHTVQACIAECGSDQNCISACYAAGTQGARAATDAIYACANSNCASETTQEGWLACLGGKCGQKLKACDPPSGCAISGNQCGSAEACALTPTGDTDCWKTQNKGVGDACTTELGLSPCASGLVCLNGACRPECEPSHPCTQGATCEPLTSTTYIGGCEGGGTDGGTDAGNTDGGPDAGSTDGGSTDGGSTDGPDAGSTDGGSTTGPDAGTSDGTGSTDGTDGTTPGDGTDGVSADATGSSDGDATSSGTGSSDTSSSGRSGRRSSCDASGQAAPSALGLVALALWLVRRRSVNPGR